MSKVAQYVGIAAPTRPGEVEQLRALLDALDWLRRVWFMNGPLVSYKTLSGQEPGNPNRYPPFDQVAALLLDDPRFFNVVHYNSRERVGLHEQLEQLAQLPNLHGIQLNIAWPPAQELRLFCNQYPDIQLILQVGREALEKVDGIPDYLVSMLTSYQDLAEYALIDPSGGENQPYDHEVVAPLLEALVEADLPMKFGVTGGLCAERCPDLARLLEICPSLCWDAESGLRTPDDTALDMDKCRAFLAASRTLLA